MRARFGRALGLWAAAIVVAGIGAAVTGGEADVEDLAATTSSTTTATLAAPAPSSTYVPDTTVPQSTTTTRQAIAARSDGDDPSTVPTTGTTPVATSKTAPIAGPATAPAGVPRTTGEVLLVWTSGGLRDGYAESVASIPQVTAHTTVSGDLLRLLATADADGTVVDRAADGWAYPIDAFAIDPTSYASFQRPEAQATLDALRPGGAVLTRSSAKLRGLDVQGTLTFDRGSVTVSGIVDDRDGGGAEVLVHRDDAARLGIDDERFLLLTDSERPAVEDEIRRRTPSDLFLSLRSEGEAPFLRHGDRVDPQVLVKLAFGEFAFSDAGGREIRQDPAWTEANIISAQVPLLGTIRCHRAIVPLVRAAMEEVEAAGDGGTVNPSQYAGCHYARRIAAGAGLSRHSWGLALDLNIGPNPRGDYGSQHPTLVAAMRRQGFNWGGDWEFPDPGHYEKRA